MWVFKFLVVGFFYLEELYRIFNVKNYIKLIIKFLLEIIINEV